MKLLALETSAVCASCAVTENGAVLARSAVHVSLTHSQTLLPMVEAMLRDAGLSLSQMDALAVAAGPGSFTGVRIGVAAVKGLAFPGNIPCVPVSTLGAMARRFEGFPFDGILCTAMDARCGQIYSARFACSPAGIVRLTPDEALPAEAVCEALCKADKPILLIGDGAQLCYTAWKDRLPTLWLAPEALRMQDAVGVALEGERLLAEGGAVEPKLLQPKYLRLPQAERELKARRGET